MLVADRDSRIEATRLETELKAMCDKCRRNRNYLMLGLPRRYKRQAATFTDSISTTITTLEAATHHYNVIKEDRGLREAFHAAGRGLLLIGRALQTAKTQLGERNLAKDPQSAIDSLKKCNTNVGLSKTIFNAVAQAPET